MELGNLAFLHGNYNSVLFFCFVVYEQITLVSTKV